MMQILSYNCLVHLHRVDSSTTTLWTNLFPIAGCLVYRILGFKEIPVFNANSADPDQMLQNAASDQGLHCLPPIILLGVSRLKWANVNQEV